MTELADTFDAAFSKAVDLGNRIADKDKDADLWDIADGLLAGAIQYWLYSRQPCGDPRCQDCMPISTAQGRMAELNRLIEQLASESEYFHTPPAPNPGPPGGVKRCAPAASARGLHLHAGAGRLLERQLEQAESLLEHGVGNRQRCEKADHVRVHAARENDQPVAAGRLYQCPGELRIGRLRAAVLHQLDRHHGAERPHLAHTGEAHLQALEP